MDAPVGKRALDQIEDPVAKKAKLSDDDTKLSIFLDWCKDGNLQLSNKVCVSQEGSCAQYGMIATEDIDEGEVLFTIPRTLLLQPETSAIADLLEKEAKSLKSPSGWVPLLVALLHEYTSPNSQWRAYMDLVPDFSQLDLPMFWPRETVETELTATGVVEAVQKDEDNIEKEFNSIVLPFVKSYPQHFPSECSELSLYKKMVAFTMAYSFTEPPPEDEDKEEEEEKDEEEGKEEDVKEEEKAVKPPMMVPMADILNHVTANNASLDFGEAELKMVATMAIKKGEEVFNTYGQLSNRHLLHMYGFTEEYPNNFNDIVEISHRGMETCLRAELGGCEVKIALFDEKWQHLQKLGVISAEDGACVVGVDGILTELEMIKTLKVLDMDQAAFTEYKQKPNDGWESDDEGEDSLQYVDFHKLPIEWKEMLLVIAKDWLSNYLNSLAVEEANLAPETWSKLSSRQQFCVNLRYGQMQLLDALCRHCHGHDEDVLPEGI